jgi:hypothetical protein
VLALLGAGGKRRPTPAVSDPVPGGRMLLSERQGRLLEELHQALINFIEYFNATMAKPFKWTYAGKPLTA